MCSPMPVLSSRPFHCTASWVGCTSQARLKPSSPRPSRTSSSLVSSCWLLVIALDGGPSAPWLKSLVMNSSHRQSGNDTPLEFFAAVRRYAKCGCGRSGLPRSIATCVGRNDWGHLNRTPNFDPLILPEEAYLARIIHDDFYCNRRYAAATSWHAVVRHASGRARSSRPQHTVSSMPRPLGAPRARLAWRLGGFVTNSRE